MSESILRRAFPVMPVVEIHREEDVLPLAEALLNGGIHTIEITLRTPCAVAAIERLVAADTGIVVGAGTLTAPEQVATVCDAGAVFAVSPGFSAPLATAVQRRGLQWLPGVATASEVMAARSAGFHALKLFPAAAVGGTALLNAFAGPFADIVFCPTGGISSVNYRDYLALPNVLCVGGSWVVPVQSIADNDWQAITALARQATAGV